MKLFQVLIFITHLAFKTQHPSRFKTSVQQDREEQWWNKALRPKKWKKDLYEIKCWSAKLMQERSDTWVADFWSVLLWRQLKTTWHSQDRVLEKRGNAVIHSKARKIQFWLVSPGDRVFLLLWGKAEGMEEKTSHQQKKKRHLLCGKSLQTNPTQVCWNLPAIYVQQMQMLMGEGRKEV